MVLILECIVVCFILLVPCVVAIANGTENASFLFEKEVEERVLKIGLITEERLEKNRKRFRFWGLSVMIAFILFAV